MKQQAILTLYGTPDSFATQLGEPVAVFAGLTVHLPADAPTSGGLRLEAVLVDGAWIAVTAQSLPSQAPGATARASSAQGSPRQPVPAATHEAATSVVRRASFTSAPNEARTDPQGSRATSVSGAGNPAPVVSPFANLARRAGSAPSVAAGRAPANGAPARAGAAPNAQPTRPAFNPDAEDDPDSDIPF